nr:MAG TPA: hypothetical protein [Caudoviricetes sp.]
MIVGCKKTVVEYRGWVNRNCYYLRNIKKLDIQYSDSWVQKDSCRISGVGKS